MIYRYENFYNYNIIVYILNIKFNCFWNLVIGYLYIFEVNIWYFIYEDFLVCE